MSKFLKNFLNFFHNLYPEPIVSSYLEETIKTKRDILTPVIFSDHIDSEKTVKQKIQLEQQRRHQAYTALDYYLSLTTYFDFFSFDSFEIAKEAKYLTQVEKKKIVTSDILLLAFLSKHLKISEILNSFGITNERMVEELGYFSNAEDTFFESLLKSFQISFPISFKSLIFNSKIEYSLEVNSLFEKAALNAIQRFKTPLIGTEILFLTLLEEEKTIAGKILKKFFKTDFDWLSLRYDLIKRIYSQESQIRTEVGYNQEYFAYILKTKLSDFEFEGLIASGNFLQSVSSFRNQLISEALKIDIYKSLEEEVYESLKRKREKKFSINRFDIKLEDQEFGFQMEDLFREGELEKQENEDLEAEDLEAGDLEAEDLEDEDLEDEER